MECAQVKALSWNRIHLLVVSIPQLSLISHHFLYQYVIYCRRHTEHIKRFIGYRVWRTEGEEEACGNRRGVVCILMLEVYVHTKLCTDCFTVSHPNITRPWLLLPPVHFIVVTLNNPSNNMDQDTVFPITCLVNQPRHVCSLKLTRFCTGATRVVDNS